MFLYFSDFFFLSNYAALLLLLPSLLYKSTGKPIFVDKKEDHKTLKRLIVGCKKRRKREQEMLYRHFYSYAMAIALRYARSPDDALEVLNDSFLKVFDKIAYYDPENSFKGWLRRIIINTAIDNYRSQHKHDHHEDISLVEPCANDLDSIDLLSVDDILALLQKLPELYRMTFNLYEIEGYSHQEIADMMGITASSSRANLTRAKYKLRELFQQHFSYENSYWAEVS